MREPLPAVTHEQPHETNPADDHSSKSEVPNAHTLMVGSTTNWLELLSRSGVTPEHSPKAASFHLEEAEPKFASDHARLYSSVGSKELERVSYSWHSLVLLVPLALVVLVIGAPTWLLLRRRRNGEASGF